MFSLEEKKRKKSSSSDDTILQAFGIAECLAEKVDFIFARLSEVDRLGDIELRLLYLALKCLLASLRSRFTVIKKSVDELKERLSFCEDDISDLKKNGYDIKENCSLNTDELRKQILYLETNSRRENLKIVGIPEEITSNYNICDAAGVSSEHTAAVIYKFMADELNMKESEKRIEFQHIHRLGKPNGKSPVQFCPDFDFFATLTVRKFWSWRKVRYSQGVVGFA